MSTPLIRFLAVLATDPGTLSEYLRNPDEVMNEAGLSEADVVALRSGDPSVLEARLRKEGVTLGATGPVYDPWPTVPTHTHLVFLETRPAMIPGAKPSEPSAAARETGPQGEAARSEEAPARQGKVRAPTH